MKRLGDLLATLVLLPLWLPVMLLVALLTRWWIGSPVLFRQPRPGLHGEVFLLLKFRTMREAVDATGQALPDIERLTTFGRMLRATSLDELPSLLNVIRGSMSLVGPRPLLVDYLPLYSERQARRHEVRPGLTGWAQVRGRNALSWRDKLECDVWYVDHRSFLVDARILALTVWKVIARSGVTGTGEATMSRFTGEDGR